MSRITPGSCLDSDRMDPERVRVHRCVEGREPPSPRPLEPDSLPLASGGVREPGGIHSNRLWRRAPAGKELVHLMETLGVKASQCLLEDGVGGGSCQSEALQELRVGGELGHETPVAEASVELEAQEDEERREGKVRRPSQGVGSGGDHSTKIHKLMEQELRMTRPGCVI